MLANGPQWTNAGPPSRVWSRFGLIASTSRTVIAPATLRSSAVTGRPSVVWARTIRPSRARRSWRSVARARIAITSLATVITVSVSRGTPFSRPPRPMTICADRPVADVDDPRPEDRQGIDPERVLVVEAVVEERRGEVVRRADGVDVAGQVEVEVLHRDDLAVAATGGAALDPEDRPERRLADRDRGPFADPVEALGEPDRGRGLALAERRRRDRRDQDVLAARVRRLEPLDGPEADLRLDRPVELQLVLGQAELGRDVDDPARRDRAGDLEVGRERSWGTPTLDGTVDRVGSGRRVARVRLADRGPHEMGEEHGVRDRADAARDRRDGPGHEPGAGLIDVTDDRRRRPR